MSIGKTTWKHLPARKLRAIASGRYLGIKSTKTEIKRAKAELKRRGLKIRLKKK